MKAVNSPVLLSTILAAMGCVPVLSFSLADAGLAEPGRNGKPRSFFACRWKCGSWRPVAVLLAREPENLSAS